MQRYLILHVDKTTANGTVVAKTTTIQFEDRDVAAIAIPGDKSATVLDVFAASNLPSGFCCHSKKTVPPALCTPR